MQNQGIKRVKLADVAEVCGVRASTVSRVLSGFSEGFSVKEDVRKLILETAHKMNYVPNAAAKQLRSKKTMNIQILGYHFRWTSASIILDHCTEILNGKGYMVNALFGDYSRMSLASMQTDGIIMLTAEDKNLLCQVRESGIPFIVINDRLEDNECWIAYDDSESTRKNMEYLIGRGCRRIVYSGPFGFFEHRTHSSIRVRRDSYLAACRKYGLEPLELPTGVLPENAAKFVRDISADGVVCYGALNAVELVTLLSVMDIRVPDQVKVASFGQPAGNIGRIAYAEVDPEQVGKAAAELLLNRIENGVSGHRIFEAGFYRAEE